MYKNGVTNNLLHGKPISLVPLASKTIEEVINNQTLSCLTKANILNANQSGFRQQDSTKFCLSSECDKITRGFNSGLITGAFLSSYNKHFSRLIIKLKCTWLSEKCKSSLTFLKKHIFYIQEIPYKCFTHASFSDDSLSAFTCWKLTIKTLEQGLKYVQS